MFAGDQNLFGFRLRAGRRATLRDIAVVVLWIVFTSVFVVDLWRSDPPGPSAGAPPAEVRELS